MLRDMLSERWDEETLKQLQPEISKALAERERIERGVVQTTVGRRTAALYCAFCDQCEKRVSDA
jgi:hypothetical protein